MTSWNLQTVALLLGLAFVGWTLREAITRIGLQLTTPSTTLMVHAIAAPLIFGVLSAFYFARYHFTSPLQTALVFVAIVIVIDIAVVALLILRSFDMFASIEGTWLPFALIFASTYLLGSIVTRRGTYSIRSARRQDLLMAGIGSKGSSHLQRTRRLMHLPSSSPRAQTGPDGLGRARSARPDADSFPAS